MPSPGVAVRPSKGIFCIGRSNDSRSGRTVYHIADRRSFGRLPVSFELSAENAAQDHCHERHLARPLYPAIRTPWRLLLAYWLKEERVKIYNDIFNLIFRVF